MANKIAGKFCAAAKLRKSGVKTGILTTDFEGSQEMIRGVLRGRRGHVDAVYSTGQSIHLQNVEQRKRNVEVGAQVAETKTTVLTSEFHKRYLAHDN